jgi:multidrug efflux pump subunit AcrB
MAPIPVLGSVAMMFSLFAAFAFTPYFVMKFVPPIEKHQILICCPMATFSLALPWNKTLTLIRKMLKLPLRHDNLLHKWP